MTREERLQIMIAEDANEVNYGEADPTVNIQWGAVRESDYPPAVDSLDDMQPVPRTGKFFAELIVRDDMQLDSGVIVPGADRDLEEDSGHPKRARVLQLGPPRDEPWDMEVGWECIVPYHAGYHFSWLNQAGVEERLWILDTNEVIAVFRPR